MPRVLIIIAFCAYAQTLCAIFSSQPGEGKSTAAHFAEWAALMFALGAAFAVSTSAYMSALPRVPCLDGWPFGNDYGCHDQEFYRRFSVFTFEMLPRMFVALCAQALLTRVVRRVITSG